MMHTKFPALGTAQDGSAWDSRTVSMMYRTYNIRSPDSLALALMTLDPTKIAGLVTDYRFW